MAGQALPVSDVIGVLADDATDLNADSTPSARGYGKQCIMRWLQAALVTAGSVNEAAIQEVLQRYLMCLAGAIVGELASKYVDIVFSSRIGSILRMFVF